MNSSSLISPTSRDRYVKLIECPRDAMQGLTTFIPTEKKINYLNQLLKVGFHTLDFGSFVSPKAIPQMRDTPEVVRNLDLRHTSTRLLAIVANERGAKEAATFEEISYLGYPFSISTSFLERNINATIEEAFKRVSAIENICREHDKKLVVYVSMAFGNPYGDDWDCLLVKKWVEKLAALGIDIISLADTVGVGKPEDIAEVYSLCHQNFSELEFGLHLHTTLQQWEEKIDAAYMNGCRRFDGVINGLGGCPMAGEKLVGNVNTKFLVQYFEKTGAKMLIDMERLKEIESLNF